MDTPPG